MMNSSSVANLTEGGPVSSGLTCRRGVGTCANLSMIARVGKDAIGAEQSLGLGVMAIMYWVLLVETIGLADVLNKGLSLTVSPSRDGAVCQATCASFSFFFAS